MLLTTQLWQQTFSVVCWDSSVEATDRRKFGRLIRKACSGGKEVYQSNHRQCDPHTRPKSEEDRNHRFFLHYYSCQSTLLSRVCTQLFQNHLFPYPYPVFVTPLIAIPTIFIPNCICTVLVTAHPFNSCHQTSVFRVAHEMHCCHKHCQCFCSHSHPVYGMHSIVYLFKSVVVTFHLLSYAVRKGCPQLSGDTKKA